MALKYWPLAVLLLLGFVVLGYLWGRRSAPYAADGLLVANTGNVRRVAAFQQLARRLLRWTTIQVASLGLVVAGCWLLAGRLGVSDENPSIQHNRDIMLCLDVSGSMSDVDAELLRGFGEIARGLKGERIGLTVWNSSAVLKFPLTHDYDFIAEQLTTAAQEMEKHSFRFLTGTNEGNGSSLIGDGIMSCLQRFDRRDSERARTMVLATDNDLSGTPIFTVEQAFAQLKEQKVVTFTIAEYDVLSYLIKKEGGAITREELIYNCSSISEESSSKSIDVIIGRIRLKLGETSKAPSYIHAIRGVGYKLVQ